MRAAEALDSREARAPWYGPGTKRGGLRRVAPAGDIPRGSGALDDQARIIAGLPPGSENGRQAPDNLAHWGLKPGRACRARLNWAHWRPDPGARARPSGQRAEGPGRFRAQSHKPERHPALTGEQLGQTVFAKSARKNFRDPLYDAKKALLERRRAHGLAIIDGKPVPVLKPAQPTSDWARRVSIDGTLSPLFSYETDPACPCQREGGRMRARPWGRPAPC